MTTATATGEQLDALRRIGLEAPDTLTRNDAGRMLADAVQAVRSLDPDRIARRAAMTADQAARVEAWLSVCPTCGEPLNRATDGRLAVCFNAGCPKPPTVLFTR